VTSAVVGRFELTDFVIAFYDKNNPESPVRPLWISQYPGVAAGSVQRIDIRSAKWYNAVLFCIDELSQ
jgi:hypothetical protein